MPYRTCLSVVAGREKRERMPPFWEALCGMSCWALLRVVSRELVVSLQPVGHAVCSMVRPPDHRLLWSCATGTLSVM
jgi:hypothetical protein